MGSASEPRSRRYLVGRQNQDSRTSTPPPCCRPPPPKPPEPTLQTSSRRPRSRSSPQRQIPLPVNFSEVFSPQKKNVGNGQSYRAQRRRQGVADVENSERPSGISWRLFCCTLRLALLHAPPHRQA